MSVTPKTKSTAAKRPAAKANKTVAASKATKRTPLVKSARVSNPGLQKIHQTRRRQALQGEAVTALMMQQRRQGTPVRELARIHRLSTKTVYSRIAKAKAEGLRPKAATSVTVVPVQAKPADQEIAYLKGRVDQLETFFSQMVSVGVKKLLRALAP